ncbi:MAG TPA: polyamine ABC transporter substrate-binding protein [Steroidobacteraceae bacterium]|jgi:putrescine transport system substrate-binding protein|nr:polyamine ABC transporter substrate-binding protein [Steroidobacteraceae bacterium]
MRAIRLGAVAAAVALAAACGGKQEPEAGGAAPGPEEKVVNVYNWSDYIGDTTIADFEKATGIKVVYAVFDSNEQLETKLLTGRSGYDLVVPTAPFMERQIKAGVYMKLDKSQLPNLANMDPEIMRRTAAHDPGNEHSVTYLWGTVGLGYNPDMVKKALGTDTIDSWGALLDPAIASKLAKCGIAILDAPTDVYGSVAIYKGIDPNSEKPEDLKAVEDTLMKIRPYVRYFHSSQYINDLASGEICLALGWNGDILQARDRGAAAAKPVTVRYVIPKEGAINYFDMMAIPADAPHPRNAHAFVNYLMDPQVIAKVTNKVRFANGNLASLPYVADDIKNDPGIYPDAATRERLHPDLAESQQFSRELNRAWTRVRSGE